MKRVTLEVAVSDVAGAALAQQCGADRLELSQALELGGLTPPPALLRRVLRASTLPVAAMVRCRAGGFRYSEQELELMRDEAAELSAAGAEALVFGALDDRGQVAQSACRTVIGGGSNSRWVFHRAIDLVADPLRALEILIDLGFERILTSGGMPTAMEGAENIARLRDSARDRIQILLGAGVRPHNVVELLRRTGCTQVHGTFSQTEPSEGGFVSPGSIPATDGRQVRACRAAIDSI